MSNVFYLVVLALNLFWVFFIDKTLQTIAFNGFAAGILLDGFIRKVIDGDN